MSTLASVCVQPSLGRGRNRRDLVKFYRKAGLVHAGLGTEAAAQMKLGICNKETKVAAAFARLFQVLVHPDYIRVETECSAVNGAVCRFEIRRLAGRLKARRI